jgi:hypothetical protein
MADNIEALFQNLRRPVFVEDPNSVPQNLGPGNGNVAPMGWLEDNSVSADVIQANAVVATKISAGAVEADKIAANAITASKIAAGAVETDKLAANAVTAAKIAANTITAAQIAANTITASQIAADSITANEIQANAITASEIAANAVTTTKILAANVTSSRMEVDISGKTFGAQSGSLSLPGYYFTSSTSSGLVYLGSIPFFGATLGVVTGGSGMQFSPTANGSFVKLVPNTDNAFTLGDSTHRWTTVYATNGTINTSDRSIKRDIADSPLGLDFINSLRPRIYRWRDTSDTQAAESAECGLDTERLADECRPWEQKIIDAQDKQRTLRGDHPDLPRLQYVIGQCQQRLNEIRDRHAAPLLAARKARRSGRRFHYGLIAQEVKEALDAAGVDAAFWQQSPDGLQSLSYSELVAPLIRAVQELSKEVAELKAAK